MDRLSKSNLPSFEAGKGISASQLNAMSRAIGELMDRVNFLLMGVYDVNLELGYGNPDDPNSPSRPEQFERKFSLEEAVNEVSTRRRQLGMKIRFRLAESDLYAEYSYIGPTINDGDFLELSNWVSGIDVVDGGTF